MKSLEFINKINIYLGKIFSWALLAMVILTCIIVVLRYAFNIGYIWMQELVRYLYAGVFMACAAYTLAEDEHVRVDIFYSKLKYKDKNLINMIGSLIFLIPVCITIIFYSFTYVVNSWAQLEGSLEERGLHAVYLLKSLIWMFAIMLLAQGIYIIFKNAITLFRKSNL
jgi:TRAP-type mannitol/chloroaromatic compound transport system permease small subunit